MVNRDLYSAFSLQFLSLVTSCLVVRGVVDEDTFGVYTENSVDVIDIQNLDVKIMMKNRQCPFPKVVHKPGTMLHIYPFL